MTHFGGREKIRVIREKTRRQEMHWHFVGVVSGGVGCLLEAGGHWGFTASLVLFWFL